MKLPGEPEPAPVAVTDAVHAVYLGRQSGMIEVEGDEDGAKKRLFYSLLHLGLPLETRTENPAHGLAFRFLADTPVAPEPVLTGHDSGIITIALAEADDAEREARRTGMGEPYRTLLGHFRHEIGHHYWDLLVQDHPAQVRFRTLFGDETGDEALDLGRWQIIAGDGVRLTEIAANDEGAQPHARKAFRLRGAKPSD